MGRLTIRKRSTETAEELEKLDEVIQEITVDAYGDDEQLWAFRQVIEDEVAAKRAWEDFEIG